MTTVLFDLTPSLEFKSRWYILKHLKHYFGITKYLQVIIDFETKKNIKSFT